jgi:hypothetical protein
MIWGIQQQLQNQFVVHAPWHMLADALPPPKMMGSGHHHHLERRGYAVVAPGLVQGAM